MYYFFFSSRRRHTRWPRDWSSDVCSSDLSPAHQELLRQRMETHIKTVAEHFKKYGEYGEDNPIVAFDVVNEAIAESEEIGRASCRERVEKREGEVGVEEK